jgi:DNA-binding transcriptional MerR regulator
MMKALPETIDQIHQLQSDVTHIKEVIDMPEDDEKENEEAHKLLSEHITEDIKEIEEDMMAGEGFFQEKETKMDVREVDQSIRV